MPAGLAKLVNNKRVNWDYRTAPEAALDGRTLWWPRGKVLGGSSSINAMCYTRGVAGDYDEWASLGAQGWGWKSVLPYFRRSERNTRGADALHGDEGPAVRVGPALQQPALARLHRSRTAGGLPAKRRLQRPHAGRLRPVPGHAEERRPLLGRGGLPGPGARTPQPHHRHRRAGQSHHLRTRPRQRRGLHRAGQGVPSGRLARGAAERRRDQLAAAADAVGHRPGHAAAPARHRCRRRRAAGRREPAGPSGHLHAAARHAADHLRPPQRPARRLRLLPARAHRRGQQQHRRSGRVRAFAPCARRATGHPAAFRPGHARRPRAPSTAGRRLHRPRLLPAAAQPRSHFARQRSRRRQGAHRGQLPRRCRKAST